MTKHPWDAEGGPAFPISIPEKVEEAAYFKGMSLRDYFAGQALAGTCGNSITGQHHQPENAAREAYAFADAMLRAREAHIPRSAA